MEWFHVDGASEAFQRPPCSVGFSGRGIFGPSLNILLFECAAIEFMVIVRVHGR